MFVPILNSVVLKSIVSIDSMVNDICLVKSTSEWFRCEISRTKNGKSRILETEAEVTPLKKIPSQY
jgi:hypothetical protein